MMGFYRHYKGGLYFVIGIGRMTESPDEKVVVYYSFKNKTINVRPLVMFNEEVMAGNGKDGRWYYSGPRFRKVSIVGSIFDLEK